MSFFHPRSRSCGPNFRLLVRRDIAPAPVRLVVNAIGELRRGNPLDPRTPMAFQCQYDKTAIYLRSVLESIGVLSASGP